MLIANCASFALGVIDEAEFALHPGLNVVTGETGAGKTMVVTGPGAALRGARRPGLVRVAPPRPAVEGVIEGRPSIRRSPGPRRPAPMSTTG
jgi:DNA repair ATPase RecN